MKAVVSGIYFLFDGDNIVYVGQSADIYRRIYEHSSGRAKGDKKTFDSFEFFEVDDEQERKRMEALLIRLMRPKYNIDIPDACCCAFKDNGRNTEKIHRIEYFIQRFDEYSHTMSFSDCDMLFGVPRGTFFKLAEDGEIEDSDTYRDFLGLKSRIKLDAVERMARNYIKR